MNDFQFILNIGVAIVLAVSGWFFRVIWDAVNRLKEDLHELEVELPSHYLRKDEFAEGMKE